MRQFLLVGAVAYTAATDFNAIAPGAIGVYYNDNGVPKVTATGVEITGEAMIVLGRAAANGGPIVLPLHPNNFSYVKGVYKAAVKYKGTVVVPAPTEKGTYSIIVALKGVKFNERNKFTASVYVSDTATTAAQLATQLAAQINNNTTGSGVTATVASATITIDGVTAGDDYNIIPADKLTGATATVTTVGEPAYGDAAYVVDLANKAAADAGFNYTYDASQGLYPNHPLNPLAVVNSADVGFTIFTLRFAEPRMVKTRDEVVNQIVQVAFPTGALGITTFGVVCETLAGNPPAEE